MARGAWGERPRGRNLALRWDPQRPQVGVDPDVYLVEPDLPEGERAKSLCTWRPGHHAPRVCVEVVSEGTAEKDYEGGPERYAASGASELWVFDPGDPRGDRRRALASRPRRKKRLDQSRYSTSANPGRRAESVSARFRSWIELADSSATQ